MNKIYTLLFCLFTIISTAQNENKSKTLEVVGFAKMAVSPDMRILNINLNKVDIEFSQSIKRLNSKSQDITNQLKEIGFDQSAIRTKDFDVRKNKVNRKNRRVDSGYIATQKIQLEFKNNKDNIAKILSQFSKGNTEFNLDLDFDFKLSDTLKESVQEEIIQLATEDAFSKAKLISQAAKIDLKKVSEINYGNSYNAGMSLNTNNYGLNEVVTVGFGRSEVGITGFTPEDIIYTDNILVIWNLK